jgi:hypothetical protein
MSDCLGNMSNWLANVNSNLLELKTQQIDWKKNKKKFEKNIFFGGGGANLNEPPFEC